jgi:hypothetical protein
VADVEGDEPHDGNQQAAHSRAASRKEIHIFIDAT